MIVMRTLKYVLLVIATLNHILMKFAMYVYVIQNEKNF